MKTEELTKLGIEDEKVRKEILKLHGLGIEKFKKDLKTLDETNKTLTKEKGVLDDQLTQAGKTIESFKDLDVEGVKKSAADWKEKAEEFEKAKDEAEEAKTKEVAKIKFDHALDEALGKAGSKSTVSVKAHLNLDELRMAKDGKTITGLDAQLETIVKDNEFLFDPVEEDPDADDDDETPKITTGIKSKSILADRTVQAAREAAGLKADQKE